MKKKILKLLLLSVIVVALCFSSQTVFALEDTATTDEIPATFDEINRDDYWDNYPSFWDEASWDEASPDSLFTSPKRQFIGSATALSTDIATDDCSGSGPDGEDASGLYLLGGVMCASVITVIALSKRELNM